MVGPASVPYLDGDEVADFTGVALGSGWLIDPAGIRTPAVVALGDTPDVLDYTLDGDQFTAPGIWSLTTDLTVGGNTFRIAPAPFVVEGTEGWLTIAAARGSWRDAPSSDVVLWRLLDMARQQVEEYARKPLPAVPTSNLVTAQHTQARNIWNATKTDPSSQGIGDEGFVIRPFPLDWTVKQMIRPVRAVPVVR